MHSEAITTKQSIAMLLKSTCNPGGFSHLAVAGNQQGNNLDRQILFCGAIIRPNLSTVVQKRKNEPSEDDHSCRIALDSCAFDLRTDLLWENVHPMLCAAQKRLKRFDRLQPAHRVLFGLIRGRFALSSDEGRNTKQSD